VGEGVRTILEEWVRYLREDLLWGNDDPLFPSTRMALGPTSQFEAVGIEKKHWSNPGPVRAIFRDAFTRAGLQYFNPHSIRSTLALLGETLCQTPEDFKAWSQNLGHEQVLTTFTSYGNVPPIRQAEILRALTDPGAARSSAATTESLAQELLRQMRQQGLVVSQGS
jgi:integrase/recombinase XerD